MTEKLKYILGILIAVIALLVIGYFIFSKKEVTKTTSSTNTTKTTSVQINNNTFTIEQVGKIKKALTDSLELVYGGIIKRLKSGLSTVSDDGENNLKNDDYSYISEIDSTLIAKDSSGNATDEIRVKSTFISPEPLAGNSLHLLRIDHKSFSQNINIQTTKTDSIFIKESSGLLDLFSINPNISAGYGLLHKQFDIYAGIGINIKFDVIKIFN